MPLDLEARSPMQCDMSQTLILCLHEVTRAAPASPWAVNDRVLDRLIGDLADAGWALVSLEDVADPRPRRFVLTLDDARSGAVAWLLSSGTEARATIFPIPLFIESPDRIPAQELYSGFCDYEQLAAARARGHAIGSHGMTHRPLPELPFDDAERELRESRARLETVFGAPVDRLALPFGKYSDEVIALARAAGYRQVFNTRREINTDADVAAGFLNRMALRSDRERMGLPEALFQGP